MVEEVADCKWKQSSWAQNSNNKNGTVLTQCWYIFLTYSSHFLRKGRVVSHTIRSQVVQTRLHVRSRLHRSLLQLNWHLLALAESYQVRIVPLLGKT